MIDQKNAALVRISDFFQKYLTYSKFKSYKTFLVAAVSGLNQKQLQYSRGT